MSAYENKILRPEIRLGAWFLNNYGEPTFPKFVDVIIEGAKDCDIGVCQNLDEHWKPFNAGCTYCDLKYNYITKVSQLELYFDNNIHPSSSFSLKILKET